MSLGGHGIQERNAALTSRVFCHKPAFLVTLLCTNQFAGRFTVEPLPATEEARFCSELDYFAQETRLSLRRRAESSFCCGLSSEEKTREMLFSNSGIVVLYSLTPFSVSTT